MVVDRHAHSIVRDDHSMNCPWTGPTEDDGPPVWAKGAEVDLHTADLEFLDQIGTALLRVARRHPRRVQALARRD